MKRLKSGLILVQRWKPRNRHFCVTFASLLSTLQERRLWQAWNRHLYQECHCAGLYNPVRRWSQTRHSAAFNCAEVRKVAILAILLDSSSEHPESQESSFLRINRAQVRIWLGSTLFYPIFARSCPIPSSATRQEPPKNGDNPGQTTLPRVLYPGLEEGLSPEYSSLHRDTAVRAWMTP